MIDDSISWNIDGIQANTVLEGAEVSIPIDRNNYNDIIIDSDLRKYFVSIDEYLKKIINSEDGNLNRSILKEFHLKYYIKDNKYYIGYDYNEIFNNILALLGLNKSINTSKITNKDEFYNFINEFKREIIFSFEIDMRNSSNNKEQVLLRNNIYRYINDILKTLLSAENALNKKIELQINEEKELRENKKKLETGKEKHISWKNLMYYTSIKALNIFDNTNNLKYYRYAKNYYLNVSMNMKAEFPNGMYVDGEFFDYHYSNYNTKFMNVRDNHFSSVLVRLNIEDKDTVTVDRTLKNGHGMRGIVGTGTNTPKKKQDFSKINATLARKITFYQGLSGKCQGVINSLDTDINYIGYVFPNNYVVFDKFYDVSKDGTKVVPATNNAVYITTLDVLESCDQDRSKIRRYISANHDYKAFRFNHTDADSYQDRINEIIEYSNISTTSFKEYKLKHEIK